MTQKIRYFWRVNQANKNVPSTGSILVSSQDRTRWKYPIPYICICAFVSLPSWACHTPGMENPVVQGTSCHPKKNVQNLCRLPFWNVKFKNPSSLLISPVISWVVALDQCQQILTSVRHPPTLQPPFSPAQKWHPPQKGEDQEWPCRKASPPRFHQDSTYFGWMFACFPYFPAFSAIRHVNCQC